jgi:hypothetical protein
MAAGPKDRMAKRLKDKAVYWAPVPGGPGDGPGYAAPVQIKCRWEDRTQEIITEAGVTVKIMSSVISDRKLEEQGVLWLGPITGLTSTTDPFAQPLAKRIEKITDVPDAQEDQHVYRAFM